MRLRRLAAVAGLSMAPLFAMPRVASVLEQVRAFHLPFTCCKYM